MFEHFLIGGFAWLCLCIGIGAITSNKNKWGPDAVQNWCDASDDRINMFMWLIIGIVGKLMITNMWWWFK